MRLSERALKDQLYDIAENDFALPEHADPLKRALEMMPHLGSPDSELRDDLIYATLSKWILDELFDEDQLKTLLGVVLDDEHLFHGLGEVGTDSVFMRSFALLLVPLILAMHRRRPFLTREEVRQVKSRLLDYLEREQDGRDYVAEDEKGWAFAVAHAADALDELAQCKELEGADLAEILQMIRQKSAAAPAVYRFEEDERLVTPVIAALQRKLLKEADVKEWLAGFVPMVGETEPFPDAYFRALNVKLFLRSLYFRARQPQTAEAIGEASAAALADLVAATLAQIGRF